MSYSKQNREKQILVLIKLRGWESDKKAQMDYVQDKKRDENIEDGHVYTEGVNRGPGIDIQTPPCVNETDG